MSELEAETLATIKARLKAKLVANAELKASRKHRELLSRGWYQLRREILRNDIGEPIICAEYMTQDLKVIGVHLNKSDY